MTKHKTRKQKTAEKGSPDRSVAAFLGRYAIVILVILCVAVYIRTVGLKFVDYDDNYFIITKSDFNSHIGNIFTAFARGLFDNFDNVYYRPVFQVDMILDYQLFGDSPAGYHFFNLLSHCIAVILLFLFFGRLKIDRLTAFLLSALFAVHPVLSQAVAWIPGRNDVLLMIFLLSCILVTLKYQESPGPLLWAAQFVLFLLALFTKETAMILPLILIILTVYVLKTGWKNMVPLIAGWVIALVGWYFARHFAVAGRMEHPVDGIIPTVFARIPAILEYLGKTIFPVNLSVFPLISGVTVSWGIAALAFLVALVTFSKSWTKPLTLFGALWFILFILPVLIIPVITSDNLFEHRAYVPLAGILILLGPALQFEGRPNRNTKLAIMAPVILLFAVISFMRLDHFADPLAFWSRAAQDSPRSFIPRYRYASLTDMKTAGDRESFWMEIRTLDPHHPGVATGMGEISLGKGYFSLAERYFREEMARAKFPMTYKDMARLYTIRMKPDSVLHYLEEYRKMQPADASVVTWLACLLVDRQHPAEAVKVLASARDNGEMPATVRALVASADSLDKTGAAWNTKPWNTLRMKAGLLPGSLFLEVKDYHVAEACFRSAAAADPASPEPWLSLARLYFLRGQVDMSIACLRQAAVIDPTNSLANNNLADLYNRSGQTAKAQDVIGFMKSSHITINPKLLEKKDTARR
jgi:protein O-mannosyl-transferase